MSKAIGRRILLAVCGVILGVNLYSANANSLVGNQLPMPFGYGAAVVLSGSMEPELSVNDLIFVKESKTYAIDEVVVFQSGKELVVHRIVDIADGMVQTKGDANNATDEPVELSAIKGKVVLAIPFIGALVSILKTPVGTALTLAVAFLLIEMSNRKERQKDDEELDKIREEIRKLKED